jgi:hypothetical protein
MAFGVGAFVGSLLASLVGYLYQPLRVLSEDQVIVLVAQWCPFSRAALVSAERHPQVARAVTPVPIGDATDEFRRRACDVATPLLRQRAPRFWLVPEDWICGQLWRAGTNAWARSSVSVPAYVRDERQISTAELRDHLAQFSLALRDGVVVPLDVARELGSIPRDSGQERPAAVVRGYDIDF